MDKLASFLKDFVREEDGSTTNEYGGVYLLVAVALFVLFAVFHGGLLATVQLIAGEFVSKLDSMSIANSNNPGSM